MKRLRRFLTVLVVLIGLVAVGAGGYGYATVRASWPEAAGELSVSGLQSDVRVLRDARGVPQIYAASDHDLMLAQGYTHAQDRFFEMDFRRHVTAGRLSELFGASQLDTDKFLRTIGWRRVAERELTLLNSETVALLQAYADGVNAWLADHHGADMSLEYAVLGLQVKGYEPEPWTPVDSIAWLKAMAWDLRGNMDEEMDRTIAAAAVGVDRTEELYPAYPFDRHAPIVTQGGVRDYTVFDGAAPARINTAQTMRDIETLIALMPAYFGTKSEGIGSNSWVLSGKYADTGKPLLANDPHLSASMPSIWTQVGLHCVTLNSECSFDVAGWSFSGFPGVIIGHNARIGWGFTNLGPDVSDLVLEDVKGDSYIVDGVAKPLVTIAETIKVANAEPVTWVSRATEHGPLISDVSEDYAHAGKGYAVALRWTALTPGRTADAVFMLDRASDWASFRDAARSFEVPSQNLLYADVDGNIGYQAPGRIPIRSGYDGRWPVPGWDSKYRWIGYIPFDALPSVYNPREGFIVTANQAVVHARTYPYSLTTDWSYGARSQRIRDVIEGWIRDGRIVTAADLHTLQMDTRSEIASILMPAFRAAFDTNGSGLLGKWAADGYRMDKDSAGAALFAGVWRNLALDVFRDELPESYMIDGHDRWFEVMRNLLADPTNAWWDDVRTKGVTETRDDILKRAMVEGINEMRARFGEDTASWRWGALHTLTLTNQTFGKSGIRPVEMMFNRGPIEVGGSSSVVLATGWQLDKGYEVTWLPSMRQVLDLSDWDRSTWVHLTGQSGHAYSSHYVDQVDAWTNGTTYPWPFGVKAVRAATTDTLILKAG
jgi:penicillin amidase